MPAPSKEEDAKAVAIKVPARSPKKLEGGGDEPPEKPGGEPSGGGGASASGSGKGKKGKAPKRLGKDGKLIVEEGAENELSDEDRSLKEGLDLAVIRVADPEPGVVAMAIEHLAKEIKSSTTTMTSVPKPLKFLRPHYAALVTMYDSLIAAAATPGAHAALEQNCLALADVLSVLAMTMAAPGTRDSLRYKLAGNRTDLGQWGHEYLRSLAGQIGQEYTARTTRVGEAKPAAVGATAEAAAGEAAGDRATPAADAAAVAAAEAETAMDVATPDVSDLLGLVNEIAPFHLRHNAEAEAIDLLVEVQQLPKLLEMGHIDDKNFQRVCLYLLRMADYMPDPDDLSEMLKTAFEIYRSKGKFHDAARVALRMGGDAALLTQLFAECPEDSSRHQIAFLLARHRSSYEHGDDEKVNEIIGNAGLSENFLALARDLDVTEAKTPEDIYKSHLAETGGFSRRRDAGGANVDSARANLASTFVNAFVNAAYGQDSLVTPEGNTWLYKNKEQGMMSAAASLGMILLWNVEEGLTQIDKFLYSSEDYIKAGAALAVGVVTSGVRNESDPALALLAEHVESKSSAMKCAAVVGLGVAYAGMARQDVLELIAPIIADSDNINMVEVGLASLSLGLIFVGTCNEEVGSLLAQRLMESSDAELDQGMARFVCVGLGLLFLNKAERADAMAEVVKTVEHPLGRFCSVVLETCAYACTGNVLQVQRMLHACAEHLEEKAAHQAAAVLGIALVTLGDDIGSEMALRTFDHLLHYGELPIRRAVPLALALLHVSNPDYAVVEQLSRLSHDADAEVAQAAILALGVVSAGTNNSRVAQLLRQLSEFYSREANQLFCVRMAQGLNHMAKGLMTLHPFHSDRLVLSPVALGSVLALLFCGLDLKATLLDKQHYMLYYLAPAMAPRMLLTVDEELKPLPVTVRVGQVVETVGQAGRPKSITGFQTHTTPVLLGVKDRAELATTEYLAMSSVLEGVVILKKNPDYAPAAASSTAPAGSAATGAAGGVAEKKEQS